MTITNSLDQLKPIVQRALDEDIGSGDVTTDTTIPSGAMTSGEFTAKAEGIVAGLQVAELAFKLVDDRVQFTTLIHDSEAVKHGDVIATVNGPARALLTAERVALNFMQRMSGIATLTHKFVDAVKFSHAIILDTRKTVPGLRLLDKWAVRLGGGQNHRFGLYDMVLIKDNHIAAVGSLTAAVQRVCARDKRHRPIEVEVKNLNELREALPLNLDRILLDNMTPDLMKEAVQITQGRTPLEASGNVSLDNVAEIAATGVDYISIGALTHSVRALDMSLELNSS
jgi:nicotinate-nucleotide pyrophosphorylase (carboxylating)